MAAVIFSKHYSYSYIYIHHSYIYILLFIYILLCVLGVRRQNMVSPYCGSRGSMMQWRNWSSGLTEVPKMNNKQNINQHVGWFPILSPTFFIWVPPKKNEISICHTETTSPCPGLNWAPAIVRPRRRERHPDGRNFLQTDTWRKKITDGAWLDALWKLFENCIYGAMLLIGKPW